MPAYLPNTHDDLIDIPITLGAVSSGRASLTTILLLVADVEPGGGTIATYASLAEVVEDTANLNAIAIAMATAIFAQPRKVESIIIQGVAVIASSQTYVQALDAAIASGADFYCVVADTRTPATQILIATDIETKAASDIKLLFVTQDDDADWLTTGIPSAWSAVDGYERTVIVYNDDNDNDSGSDRDDCRLVGNRLAWSPDETSVGWTCNLTGGDNASTITTAAKKGFARANFANLALPLGTTATRWVDPGKNQAGRPVDHIISADWLWVRLREAVADAMTAASARGTKLAADLEGQGILLNVITAVFELGVDAHHFPATDTTQPPYRVTPEAITSADITAQRVRFTAEAQFSTGVRQVSIPVYMSADALVAA
jgi:hypothetical protein